MNADIIPYIYSKEETKQAFFHDHCDKYDYMIAVACGAVAGLVDIFYVGSPLDSQLGRWTDAQVDGAVKKFAKLCGWSPRQGKENSVASAIGFLEEKFPVNYDQRHSGDVGGLFKMSAKNHHLKSLAHSPDIIGLFFSILNQFTSTASFLDNGKLITIKTESFELQGSNVISKLFCGVANWFGHIMSDVAGSSGGRGSSGAGGRGSGVPIPFFELFQLCDFGSFQVGENRNTLATVATKVFQEGYDARHGITMAIPVLLCELSIKLAWALKRRFYHKRPLPECVPKNSNDDLRLMLIIGNGTLCFMDGADAALRSGGNWVNFFLRLNLIAWCRLTFLILKEIWIRGGIANELQKQLDAYVRINDALRSYLAQLEQIDVESFRVETERYNQLSAIIASAESEEELNIELKKAYRALDLPLPYEGSLDDFMNDKSAVFTF